MGQKQTFSLVLVGAGILLISLSFFVGGWIGGTVTWTEQMAARFQRASQNYHDAVHHFGASGEAPSAGEAASLKAAREQYMQQQAALTANQARGRWSSSLLWWLGIVVTGAGIALGLYQDGRSER